MFHEFNFVDGLLEHIEKKERSFAFCDPCAHSAHGLLVRRTWSLWRHPASILPTRALKPRWVTDQALLAPRLQGEHSRCRLDDTGRNADHRTTSHKEPRQNSSHTSRGSCPATQEHHPCLRRHQSHHRGHCPSQ